MSEKNVHLCVTRSELTRPTDMWHVRWLTEDDVSAVDERLRRRGDPMGMPLEEWRQLRDEGYSYCGIFLEGKIYSGAGLWKMTPDVWHVIAVGTDKEYRRQGMAKSAVYFVADYILQHIKVAVYTSHESNIASIRTAQSVGFNYCTNIINDDKWCAHNPRPPVVCAKCPLILS